MRFPVGALALLLTLLAAETADAAILRKKSGRAIIMGFSRTELETHSVGQYVLIENFEKNQWTGLIKKIYRVNRVRITLIDDDSEEMEVGEIFRIKPGEAPRSISRPEFDPSEVPPERDELPLKSDELVDGKTRENVPEKPQEPEERDRLMLAAGVVTRYYIVPAGKQEGDLHGTGTQLQGTYLLHGGLGFHLGIRKEDLVYTGVDQFSNYNVSVLMYFAGASYLWRFNPRWTASAGLRYVLQAKGDGSLQDTIAGDSGQPINVSVRGVGELRETDLVLHGSYDWEYVSVFIEGTLSIAAHYSTQYRWQLSANAGNGSEVLQEYRTESSFPMQVEGLTVGISLSL